jgi:hypothetical protein
MLEGIFWLLMKLLKSFFENFALFFNLTHFGDRKLRFRARGLWVSWPLLTLVFGDCGKTVVVFKFGVYVFLKVEFVN